VANPGTAQHIVDLFALCLGVVGDAAQIATHRGLAAARLDAIKAKILLNLATSDLALTTIAANNGLSTRYIQHLFELSGESFTGFDIEQRLLSALRLLRESKGHARKVGDVATGVCFSDISHFNRAFRARFGAMPREVRASLGQIV